jgi:hypothetical protein
VLRHKVATAKPLLTPLSLPLFATNKNTRIPVFIVVGIVQEAQPHVHLPLIQIVDPKLNNGTEVGFTP